MNLDEYRELLGPMITSKVRLDPAVISRKDNVAEIVHHAVHDHWDRIVRSIQILDRLTESRIYCSVLDAGSWFPFIGWYFSLTRSWGNTCISIDAFPWYGEKMQHKQEDLCVFVEEAPPAPYDVVICQEVLEHLPCNVHAVVSWLKKSCDDFLMMSVPIGSLGVDKPKDAVIGKSTQCSWQHLREFREHELEKIVGKDEFDLVQQEYVSTPAYPKMELSVWRRKRGKRGQAILGTTS